MNINTDSMHRVNDVKKSKRAPDLRYSDSTERWTINEGVQETLDLVENGLVMYVALDDNGEQVVIVEVVDTENADFFTGEGNVFTAHRLWDHVEHQSLAFEPVDDMENAYALVEWEGESPVLENTLDLTSEEIEMEDESSEDYSDDIDSFTTESEDEEFELA